ncbi:MAG: arginine--tRNA ligase [Planctomycetes bacterium]|nr:arginine--tRNA ligase [Planctomycetota bacterium]
MNPFHDAIRALVTSALGLPADTVVAIATPPNPAMGDYTVAMFPFAKALGAKPPELAQRVTAAFAAGGALSSVTAAGPFVNVRISRPAFFAHVLGLVGAGRDSWGGNADGAGKTVVIDYSSPNISKHLAYHHIRSTMIGHSLCRIYAANGWKTVGLNFLGDWGTTHGMLLAAWERWGAGIDLAEDGVAKLNALYVQFRAAMKEDATLEPLARTWFKRLEDGDAGARDLWERFRQVSLAEFEKVYSKLGVAFDAVRGESYYEGKMQPVIDDLAAKGLLVESEGARVVDLTDRKLPPCILVKSDGATIYATRDLASATDRWDSWHFDRALYVVDKGQTVHFKQWFAVAEKAGWPFAGRMVHVQFGQVLFGGRKTSTRAGGAVLLHEVLDEAAKEIEAVIAEKNPSMTADKRSEVARQVGYGAIVYADLSKLRSGDVEFDWERLLSFEGDTGPFCQYQHARIASVVRKAGADLSLADASLLGTEEEWRTALLVADFPQKVRDACAKDEPSIVATYALDLCRAFSSWYAQGSKDAALKVNCDDAPTANARLALASAVRQTLANALFLIGLAAPEEM